jgi:hypothetical protein
MLDLALAMLLALHAPRERALPVAQAIARVADTPREAAWLATISLYENNVAQRGVPFGMCARFCARHCGMCRAAPLDEAAKAAVAILRRAYTACGSRDAAVLGHFHHGSSCRADAFSEREARTVARLVRIQTTAN